MIGDPPSPERETIEAAARRVAPVFSGQRLVALRELRGDTQAALAAATGITASALSQAERGETALSAVNIAKVAEIFEVNPDAFVEVMEPDLEMKPQFRHLRRTSIREQRKAERFCSATARVASLLRHWVIFPEPFSFTYGVNPEMQIDDVVAEIDRAAGVTRSELGLPRNGAIGSKLIDQLEAGGVTVVRDPETDRNIDAYSAVVGHLPVIVLDGGEGSVWGSRQLQYGARTGAPCDAPRNLPHPRHSHRRSAGAQVCRGISRAPRKAMQEVLPRDLNWSRYLRLKREWGMSIAALVRRAKDLGVIEDTMYTRAMKYQSARGWRRVEPGSTDRSLPAPRLLRRAMARAQISSSRLANRAGLPIDVVLRIVGEQKPTLIH